MQEPTLPRRRARRLVTLMLTLFVTACGAQPAAQTAMPPMTPTTAGTNATPASSTNLTPAATTEATTTAPASTTAAQPASLPMQTVQVGGIAQSLTLPQGFQISVFASNLPGGARMMAFNGQGVLYVSIPDAGQIVALPDANNDGSADGVNVVASRLNRPHGLVFHDDALWVAETGAVVRLSAPDAQGVYQQRQTVIGDLPSGGQHWSRTIGFGPDGGLYVAAGSDCNVCQESDPRRAAITRYNADGTNPQPFARGLRNAVGFIWNDAGELIATNNGRDNMGDDVPPETINITRGGDDFGWPRCHAGTIPDPQFAGDRGCDGVTQPALTMQAHSAPLGLRLYTGTQFPAPYQGNLFVAFHGSWNRSEPTGYKIVRVTMENGRPVASEDFISGWLNGGSAWGRPVDVIVGADGSMYITDDVLNAVYRVTYSGAS